MKEPLQTLPFLYYGDATKIAINHIAHILHRSTYQPRLKDLPLPPLLPQTQSENIQLQNIPRIPVLIPGVRLVLQPLIVQRIQSEPTSPPRMQPPTSPILDPDPNPWI